MNKPFAKLFDTERGQILVKIDQSDEGDPEIRFFTSPPGLGVGVCSAALTFEDSESGWEKAEQAFEKVDMEMALKATARLMEFVDQLGGAEG